MGFFTYRSNDVEFVEAEDAPRVELLTLWPPATAHVGCLVDG